MSRRERCRIKSAFALRPNRVMSCFVMLIATFTTTGGGSAILSGVTCRTIDGEYGILDVKQLEDKVRPLNDHLVHTRLVALENTHNRGGGRIYPLEKIEAISEWAHKNGLLMHLDGARSGMPWSPRAFPRRPGPIISTPSPSASARVSAPPSALHWRDASSFNERNASVNSSAEA